MKGKDELEGTRSNFTPWLCDFEHQGELGLIEINGEVDIVVNEVLYSVLKSLSRLKHNRS